MREYLPFIELREHAPKLPLMIQTDIGSAREMIRDRAWIERFATCTGIGVTSTTLYEYFIGGWSYQEPPRATMPGGLGIGLRSASPGGSTRPTPSSRRVHDRWSAGQRGAGGWEYCYPIRCRPRTG